MSKFFSKFKFRKVNEDSNVTEFPMNDEPAINGSLGDTDEFPGLENQIEDKTHPSLRKDKCDKITDCLCNIICIIGLFFVILAAISSLTFSIVLITDSKVDNVLFDEAENYIKSEGLNYIQNLIYSLQIDPVTGTEDLYFGKIYYTIDKIKIISFNIPPEDTDFTIGVKSITVSSSHCSANITFNWSYDEKGVIDISDSGKATGYSSNSQFTIGLDIRSDSTMKATSCSVKLNDISIEIDDSTGRPDSLYNLLVSSFQDEVATEMEDEICDNIIGQVFTFDE